MFKKTLIASAIGLLAAPLVAQAGVVLSGTIIDASPPHSGWSPQRLVDQSGLSATYTNGVTDFAAYLAGSPTHLGTSTSTAAGWFAPGPAYVIVDLGSTYTLGDMILWNDNDSQGVNSFSVEIADNPAMTGATSLGSFAATYGPSDYSIPVAAQPFDLTKSALLSIPTGR